VGTCLYLPSPIATPLIFGRQFDPLDTKLVFYFQVAMFVIDTHTAKDWASEKCLGRVGLIEGV